MLSIVANQLIYPEVIIKSTITITSSLINSIQYLNAITKKTNNNELNTYLNLNEVVEDIGIIKSFIEEKQNSNLESKTMNICIENLSIILSELEYNINSITRKIENHHNLWFNYFRSYNISSESSKIPKLIEKMRHRFEILIKISSVI
jgi:hypothetical protein